MPIAAIRLNNPKRNESMMHSQFVWTKKWRVWVVLLLASVGGLAHAEVKETLRPASGDWPPVIGAWFWNDETLKPDGYRAFLDAAAAHSPYTLLSTSPRVSQLELTDPALHDQVGQAARYARSLGLKLALDLDLRLARRVFRARYPDELQEELVLKILTPSAKTETVETFTGQDLGDHMTGNSIPYLCVTSRLVRVYAFVRTTNGIDPATVREVPLASVRAAADGPRKLTVTVPPQPEPCVCLIASHTYLTPDVFAPHLLSFQREIIRQYADLPLDGVMKDEWGFPPDHSGNPAHDRYWFSSALAQAYAQQSGHRDLVLDSLLMCAGEQGHERDRQAAINRYGKLCRERNAAIEDDFYRAGKEAFGPGSFVVTHATWTPYPGPQEFRKQGLDWWDATRDIGQSDENTPYPCRTSLAKRWGFPLWYNQYYSPNTKDYAREFWAGALSGGRLNVHPLYPRADLASSHTHLAPMRHLFLTAMGRLRLLDFITRAPLDCPVAVMFGHAAVMNWASPSYNRVGMELATAFCQEGYPTDLFPSTLIQSSALRIDPDGWVCLGPQRYRAIVVYEPEFGDEQELAFVERATRGRTAVFMVGNWTRDFAARPLDAATRLGTRVRICPDDAACREALTRFLGDAGVTRVTPWLRADGTHPTPPTAGFSVLTDGTYVRVAGAKNPAGGPINETFQCQGHAVTVDATGFVAIRFDANGQVAALAAGGLRSLKTTGFDITLPERADLALIRDAEGKYRGVLQGLTGNIPSTLQAITPNWQRLSVPPLLQ